jgi:hypothetical protein
MDIKNWLSLLAGGVMVFAFAAMMWIKTDVQTMTTERTRLAKEQIKLRETKRVLEAEYALLANPLRLQKLATDSQYIELEPLMIDTMLISTK